MVTRAELAEYADHFRHRMLVEALREATASHWLRRAEDFERAKPVPPPGGFVDPESRERARAAWRRCHETAQACRNAAAVALIQDVDAEVETALSEVA